MSKAEKAAFAQGKRDAQAGRSLHAPRYKDLARQLAWERGQLVELRKKAGIR